MKLDELYRAFLPTFTMVEEEWNNFLAEKNSALSEAQNYLNAIFSITGYNLPTYEDISSTRYLGVYGNNEVHVTFEGSGIDKLFGGDMTTGTLSISRIALDSYANNIHMAMLGYNQGITVDLNSGSVSGMFNEYLLKTPWFELSAIGTVAVSGASILSEMNIDAELTELSFTYPDDGVVVKLLGDIDYYQDELGNMEYSGDVYTAYFTGWGADITLNGDFQCDFDINNTFILFSDEITGKLYVSELSLVIPSQHVVANFYNSLTGLSYDITSGSLGGSFDSFHFGTSLFDVYAHGSIYVEPVSSSSTLGIHGILDSIEITYPESTFAITVVGDVEYIQIDQGEYTYFGTMSAVYLENPTTTVSILGDFSGSYNDSNGLHLAGNLYEFHWQRDEAFISFVGDIIFSEDQLVVNEVTTLEVYGDGRYYDVSSLSAMDIVADVVGNELLALGEDANWDISAALDELLWDVINKVNGDEQDTTSPTLVSATPFDNATTVAVDSNIVLTFSENVQAGTGNIVITDGTDIRTIAITDISQVTINGNTVTINPTADLHLGSHYHVEMASGVIKDLANNVYAGTTTATDYDFSTEADSSHLTHDLYGNITFWKTNAPISNVQPTLATMPMEPASDEVAFRNLQHQSNGGYTVELWATTTQSELHSIQLAMQFSDNVTAQWQQSNEVPSGWMQAINHTQAGRLEIGLIGQAALQGDREIMLGTLTFSTLENLNNFTLTVTSGSLGENNIAPTSILCTATDTAGNYRFETIADGWYQIAGESNTAMLADAVTAQDALAALKMAVALNPNDANGGGTPTEVSPYQFLAADINRDGKVRASDALNILKMAVGLSASEDEWIYVRQDQELGAMDRSHVDWSFTEQPLDVYDDMEVNFVGVVKGDVDGSWGMVG